jgi:hypothetical protein
MNSAIKTAFDADVVESSHRGSVQEGRYCAGIDFAVVIEGAIQGYQHVFVAPILAYAIDEAASGDICAIEKF